MRSSQAGLGGGAVLFLLFGCGSAASPAVAPGGGGREAGTSGSSTGGAGSTSVDAGGSAGMTMPQHIVTPCSAETGTVDQWEDITFNGIKATGVQDVLVD